MPGGERPYDDAVITLTRRSDRARYGRGRYADWKGERFASAEGTWQPPRDRAEEAAYLYDHKPFSQVYMAMTPAEYLRISREVWRRQYPPTAATLPVRPTPSLEARFRAGEPVDAAFLDYDQTAQRFKSQEGAHRATEAERLGLRTMPVIVYVFEEYRAAEPNAATLAELRRHGTVLTVGGEEGSHRERGGSLEQRALTLLGPFEEGASYVGFTGFVGPTGVILDLDNEDTGHEALARTLGVSVADLVQAGFVRVDKHSFLNVEVHGSLNRAQIVALNRIAEPLDHSRGSGHRCRGRRRVADP